MKPSLSTKTLNVDLETTTLEVMNMFKQSNTWILLGLLSAFLLSGCQSAAQHKASVQDDSVDRITIGNVQR